MHSLLALHLFLGRCADANGLALGPVDGGDAEDAAATAARDDGAIVTSRGCARTGSATDRNTNSRRDNPFGNITATNDSTRRL